jgi:hypothetical protein
MVVYKKRITITDPNHLVLSDLPFKPGQEVEVAIAGVDKDKIALVQKWRELLKETQALHADNPMSEEEIAAEIEAYRRGE